MSAVPVVTKELRFKGELYVTNHYVCSVEPDRWDALANPIVHEWPDRLPTMRFGPSERGVEYPSVQAAVDAAIAGEHAVPASRKDGAR